MPFKCGDNAKRTHNFLILQEKTGLTKLNDYCKSHVDRGLKLHVVHSKVSTILKANANILEEIKNKNQPVNERIKIHQDKLMFILVYLFFDGIHK